MILLVCDVKGCDGDAAMDGLFPSTPEGWTKVESVETYQPEPQFAMVRGVVQARGREAATQENVVTIPGRRQLRAVTRLMCPKHKPPEWKAEGEPCDGWRKIEGEFPEEEADASEATP